MDVISRLSNLLRWDTTKRLCSVRRLVMATDVVAARIALPKWDVLQIESVRVYLTAISESRRHIRLASCAPDIHCY